MRIALLKHARHKQALRENYALGAMAECWKEWGHDVVEVRGPVEGISADAAIAHVDLTFTPPEYTAWLRRFPVALNASLDDISKRSTSPLLLRRGDAWDGRVIVKTNLNCRGYSEKQLLGRTGPGDPWRFVPLAISRRYRLRLERRWGRLPEYRVFDSVAEVPDAWWDDESLVVDRFIPEVEGDLYVLRRCMFFGNRWVNRVSHARIPVARGPATFDTVRADPPAEIMEIRESLGLDYGRLDYAIAEGRVVLYDVNKTPTMRMLSADLLDGARELARGIDDYAA